MAPKSILKSNHQLSRVRLVVLLIGTVLLGYMVVQSFAAGPMAAFEPETGTLTAGANRPICHRSQRQWSRQILYYHISAGCRPPDAL
ncbi:hypothetical protein IPG36_00945 [bacterium]|nr:MAG: hypothetical protein IPG36_00945 [bacterium]